MEEVLLVIFVCLCGLPFSILTNNSLSQTRPVTVVFSSFIRTVWSSHLPYLSVATLVVRNWNDLGGTDKRGSVKTLYISELGLPLLGFLRAGRLG